MQTGECRSARSRRHTTYKHIVYWAAKHHRWLAALSAQLAKLQAVAEAHPELCDRPPGAPLPKWLEGDALAELDKAEAAIARTGL
jgi:hypothetical protein